MVEQSQGTTYNVEEDLDKWARVKVELLTPDQRLALMKEFARLDREFHGQRIAERAQANGKQDHS
jgi:hypothetical protein